MQRAIHIFPQLQNISLIERLRKKYDPLYGFIPPHITLVFPFESEIPTQKLEQHVRNSLARVHPFTIQLQRVTASFDRYLFLNVKKGNDQIIKLHDLLYSGPLKNFQSRSHTYTPHLTVGRLKSDEDLEAALNHTQTFETSFETVVTEVKTEIIEGNGDSTIEFTVPLS
ncbi:2'-5' RNA ligase family protein [Chengkuizengella axinellae]|uniref:2'-5' RNA ligase family protein n=1 Tax=Chengkuizengella axinellae TaxID=3064388 RepID=A0ABT9J045_9BACL|nr:2'-5' RNA ligase family protein [Chengkuizengella sp. 2205SS18-9]MDP5274940.1 2'-5' RNA ligase family protein [Chengkuizengella sp. 2205SS18-9]